MAQALTRNARQDTFEQVSAETGHPIHKVISCGIAWCRKNPKHQPDFDQTFPDSFETEVVEANAADAGRLIAEAQTVRVPFDAPMSASRQKLIMLRREAAKGGVKFVGNIGDREVLNSSAFSEDEADALEPVYRDTLHFLAARAPDLALPL